MSKRIGVVLGDKMIKIISSENGIIYSDFSTLCWNPKTKEVMMYGSDALNLKDKIEKPLKILNPISNGLIPDRTVFEKVISEIINDLDNCINDSDLIISFTNTLKTKDDERFVLSVFEKFNPKLIRIENILKLAAIGAGADIEDEYGTIFLDISYSQSIVGVVAENKVIAERNSKLGEEELNNQIIKYFNKHFGIEVTPDVVDKVKFNIGSVIKLREELEINIEGKDIITGEKTYLKVSNNDFKKIFSSYFTSYKTLITEALEECPIYIRTSVIKNGLIITGNISKIFGIKDFFHDFFDFPVKISKAAGNTVLEGMLKIKITTNN